MTPLKYRLITILLLMTSTYAYSEFTATHVFILKNNEIHMVNLVETTSTSFIVETSSGDTLNVSFEDIDEIKKISEKDSISDSISVKESIKPPVTSRTKTHETDKISPTYPKTDRDEFVESNLLTDEVLDQRVKYMKIALGFVLPAAPEEFTDYWKTGYNFSVELSSRITRSTLFGAEICYSAFALDASKLERELMRELDTNIPIIISGGTAKILTAMFMFKSGIKDLKTPSLYFNAGFGYFRLSYYDVTLSANSQSEIVSFSNEDAFTIFPGIGFSIPLNESNQPLVIELGYILGFTEGDVTNYFPIRLGFMFDLK